MTETDKHVELEGIVKECNRGTILVEFIDDTGTGRLIRSTLSGKMKMNKINVLPGDKVVVKVSPYDMTRGFIFKLIKSKGAHVTSSGHK